MLTRTHDPRRRGASCSWSPYDLHANVSHGVFPDLTRNSLIDSVSGAAAASDAIVDAVMAVRAGTKLDGSTASW